MNWICPQCHGRGSLGELFCECAEAIALQARIDANPEICRLRARIDGLLDQMTESPFMSDPKSTEDIARIVHEANERTKADEVKRLAAARQLDAENVARATGAPTTDPLILEDDLEPVDLDDLEDAAMKAEQVGWRRAISTSESDVGYYVVAARPRQILKLIAELRELRNRGATP